jgi:hypothetical protein
MHILNSSTGHVPGQTQQKQTRAYTVKTSMLAIVSPLSGTRTRHVRIAARSEAPLAA